LAPVVVLIVILNKALDLASQSRSDPYGVRERRGDDRPIDTPLTRRGQSNAEPVTIVSEGRKARLQGSPGNGWSPPDSRHSVASAKQVCHPLRGPRPDHALVVEPASPSTLRAGRMGARLWQSSDDKKWTSLTLINPTVGSPTSALRLRATDSSVVAPPQTEVAGDRPVKADEQHDKSERSENLLGGACWLSPKARPTSALRQAGPRP
jgi:hypothetical protein